MSSPTPPGTPSPAGTRPDRASLAVVYATVFLDLLGFGIILPSLPFFARELGATGLGLGLLFTSYSGAQLIGAAVLGRLSDRFGRRPILLLSLAGSALAMTLSGLAGTLFALCLARAFAGLAGGSIAAAQAYVADVTAPAERARYMGKLGAAIGTGFVVGPALGAGVVALGWGFAGAAFVAAGLAALNWLFAFWRLVESRPVRAAGSAPVSAPSSPPSPLVSPWKRPELGRVFAGTFLTTFAFVGMETTFAFFGADRFALDERGFGLVLVYVGVIVIAIQGAAIGPLSRRFGVRATAIAGSAALAAGLLVLPFGPSLGAAVAALGAVAAGRGLAMPSLSTLVSTLAGADEQGRVLGLGQSLAAAARAAGPLVAGALYDQHLGAPYLLGGALAALAAALVASGR